MILKGYEILDSLCVGTLSGTLPADLIIRSDPEKTMGHNASEDLNQEEGDGNVGAARGLGTPIPRDGSSVSGLQVGEEARTTARGYHEDQRGLHQDVWRSAGGMLL